MVCPHPTVIIVNNSPGIPNGTPIEVGCGKCFMCRMQRINEWVARLTHESYSYKHDGMCFLNMTYEDLNVPLVDILGTLYPSVSKIDVQLFMKRLRKLTKVSGIKYFISAEYGERTFRPHYHGILFGYYPSDLVFYKITRQGYKLYTSEFLNSVWNKGHVVVGHVSSQSIRYVMEYLFSKVQGVGDIECPDEIFKDHIYNSVFSLKSNGLGLDYALANRDKILKNLSVKIDGKEVGLPRYYKKKLEIDSNALLDKKYNSLKYRKFYSDNFHEGKKHPVVDKGIIGILEQDCEVEGSYDIEGRLLSDYDREDVLYKSLKFKAQRDLKKPPRNL